MTSSFSKDIKTDDILENLDYQNSPSVIMIQFLGMFSPTWLKKQ